MQEYVLAFLYDVNMKYVALVKKNKPDWQKGKYNGIGGKVEPGESPIYACSREFLEETGVEININFWEHFLTFKGPEYKVHCFASTSDKVFNCQTIEREEIHILKVKELNYDMCVYNLRWIIPLSTSPVKMITESCETRII